jgi:hypothetical protein
VKERYLNRIDILQGTLDMLIPQTLHWGAAAGKMRVEDLYVQGCRTWVRSTGRAASATK